MKEEDGVDAEVELPLDENSSPTMVDSVRSEEHQRGSKPEESKEDTTPREMPEGASASNESLQTEDSSEREFDPQQEGIEEAQKEKDAVGGSTELERTERALQSKLRSLESFQEELRNTKERIHNLQSHLEDLQNTIERVEEASENQRVMEHLDSQVASIEVPPDKRDDFVVRLEEKETETEENIKETQERGGAVQRGLQKNKVAVRFLQEHRQNIQGNVSNR